MYFIEIRVKCKQICMVLIQTVLRYNTSDLLLHTCIEFLRISVSCQQLLRDFGVLLLKRSNQNIVWASRNFKKIKCLIYYFYENFKYSFFDWGHLIVIILLDQNTDCMWWIIKYWKLTFLSTRGRDRLIHILFRCPVAVAPTSSIHSC